MDTQSLRNNFVTDLVPESVEAKPIRACRVFGRAVPTQMVLEKPHGRYVSNVLADEIVQSA